MVFYVQGTWHQSTNTRHSFSPRRKRELCNLLRETIGHPFRIKVLFVCLVVFNATFNNIPVVSWRSVLLVEETGGHGENHRPVASH
jgi:hypothetical protein